MNFIPNQTASKDIICGLEQDWGLHILCVDLQRQGEGDQERVKHTAKDTEKDDENVSPDLVPLHTYTKDYTVW